MELTGETKDWGRGMAEAFSMVKDQAPLVHMIANYVTASFCADAMAAIGARPRRRWRRSPDRRTDWQ